MKAWLIMETPNVENLAKMAGAATTHSFFFSAHTLAINPWFTLYYGAPPSSSYHSFFHQWFTLHLEAPPSLSYYSSFHQRSLENRLAAMEMATT
ncbi:hypothetical protein Taro_047581 [Colocasia esculenta]|uniref:Uncharacterized protein n=1 Tax=Colocasia esculenta TaxID=4460 RepID=A0A843X199_COLES|nr:hypothetical protein [Colocasia esculenta]